MSVRYAWNLWHIYQEQHLLLTLAGIPAEGKSSVCLICMKYRIIILIIIIISLDKILSYIANTSRTHARMHGRTHGHTRVHAHPHTTVAVSDASETMADRRLIEINRPPDFPEILEVFSV